jgi:hypothetical protein
MRRLTGYRKYPQYRFHFLRYPRIEYLMVSLNYSNPAFLPAHASAAADKFSDEMIFSLANLYVASEAQGFVGTLTSNWCMMIHHLERTRGDGGYDYFSMDGGSVFTLCF